MKILKNSLMIIVAAVLLISCSTSKKNTDNISLKDISYDAFIYAYPMMEQVKTINGMFDFMGLEPNIPVMNAKYPMENVGMPIVAPNFTSMTGGIFIDISDGPVTVEIPAIKDRYNVFQCVDVFTHNFFYMGSRTTHGDAGKYVFYNKHHKIEMDDEITPVLMEGDHAIIVTRIDIKDRSELDLVRAYQNKIKVVSAPAKIRVYPAYNKEKANSPLFVEYINELLNNEVPETEVELFEKFKAIGVMNDVDLSNEELQLVQAGIDSAFTAIKAETNNLEIGNGYFAATETFGTREYLNGDYIKRATGADFGLWGNSKEEANYFMLKTSGEGTIRFEKSELPPLSEIGFWSVTVHDKDVLVSKNEYDSYVLTTDKMLYNEDGSLTLKISSLPQEGNWLYTPGDDMVILIRVYQADPENIGGYVPPAFTIGNK